MRDPPEISILLVGDPEVGKTTFLSDLDQPFIYDIRYYNREFRFEFSDTAAPDNYTLLRPNVVVLCFDISNKETLENAKDRWAQVIHSTYLLDRELPVLMLGLKRDLRDLQDDKTVYPNQALAVAQGLRCDKYMECSARSGELVKEVFEDISKTAVLTTTDGGGLSEGACVVQ
ncbi:MAG: hypothetical protein M1825_005886 [Sarcosagium campestre]|nr:MAG: hypothetical protein M1825_005886 [Sarcosagium campestre]